MVKRLNRAVMLAALLLFASTPVDGQFCQENPQVVCNADCRVVAGIGACYYDPQPFYACSYTTNGCIDSWDDCCGSFVAGF